MEAQLDNVQTYLTLGFVPSYHQATAYLDDLLALEPVEDHPADILKNIIHDRVYNLGHREVVIPLTSGMDSRSILGACLDVFESKAIRCITVGSPEMPDSIGAAATCKRVGVSHELISPNGLEWKIDKLVDLSKQRYDETGCLVPVDSIPMFEAISDRISTRTAVLSGFLGDVITGRRLPLKLPKDDLSAVRAFIKSNYTLLDGRRSPVLTSWFMEFIKQEGQRVRGLPGITKYDLLDFSFRGRQRIFGVDTGAFANCVCPFEDSRWVGFWLTSDLSKRVGQREYRRIMRTSYPKVFGEKDEPSKVWLSYIKLSLPRPLIDRISRIKSSGSIGSHATWATRGDPRRNASVASTMAELTTSFDDRQVWPKATFPVFQKALEQPTPQAITFCRWIASAEVHIRADILST